jgi:glucosamine--fructose-6-phosphate aminotransferase (isomerizing)
VYKAAAEIGELGDNTRALRAADAGRPPAAPALRAVGRGALVLGHTRWASVGIISEPNATRSTSDELDDRRAPRRGRPYVVGALNGDVDNHADLKAEELRIPTEITTDAKVIPTLVSRRRLLDGPSPRRGVPLARWPRSRVRSPSAPRAPRDPDRSSSRCAAAGRRSTSGSPRTPSSSRASRTASSRRPPLPAHGRRDAGQPRQPDGQSGPDRGARRHRGRRPSPASPWSYDGTRAAGGRRRAAHAEHHDPRHRPRAFPHFLLKEIGEAPVVVPQDPARQASSRRRRLRVVVAPETCPTTSGERSRRAITRVLVIGQGTAAVAGQSLASRLLATGRRPTLVVEALLATELSGFRLRPT